MVQLFGSVFNLIYFSRLSFSLCLVLSAFFDGRIFCDRVLSVFLSVAPPFFLLLFVSFLFFPFFSLLARPESSPKAVVKTRVARPNCDCPTVAEPLAVHFLNKF